MTAHKDMNTRKLKRAYLRAVKQVWFWEGVVANGSSTPHSDKSDLSAARLARDHAKRLLVERGWSV